MEERPCPKIICLSNIFDQHYHDVRGEKVERCLTIPDRRDVFRCLEMASGRELIVLSSPPRAVERRAGKWLPPLETKFATHRQLFCANWDIPKLRVPLAWIFYARHVLRHIRSGDLVVMDNYEFLYVVAARLVHIFRRVTFVLVHLDGKHLIDRGWPRFLSWLAEVWGRPLLRGAILSNPILGKRLPDSMPRELAPGFLPDELPSGPGISDGKVRFFYAGALARSHGIDLLLESLDYLPEKGWHLIIAGQGPLEEQVIRRAQDPRWRDRVEHRPTMPPDVFEKLLGSNQVGLNCQRASELISSVTFPSKVFTYLSAGLLVISSKAGAVEQLCKNACFYYEEETPQSLAAAMKEVIEHFAAVRQKLNPSALCERYSLQAAATRIQQMLKTIGVEEQ
jgi:glycosyltransferase involved in cell wall biosynthesis